MTPPRGRTSAGDAAAGWPDGAADACAGTGAVAGAERPGAEAWVPPDDDVDALRAAAPGCRGCELWAPATQVVFSAGGTGARLVLVGEQPGDQEDRAGAPFVGPAGRVLEEPPVLGTSEARPQVVVTAHPSAVLRLRGKDGWDEAFGRLVADLRSAAALLG